MLTKIFLGVTIASLLGISLNLKKKLNHDKQDISILEHKISLIIKNIENIENEIEILQDQYKNNQLKLQSISQSILKNYYK